MWTGSQFFWWFIILPSKNNQLNWDILKLGVTAYYKRTIVSWLHFAINLHHNLFIITRCGRWRVPNSATMQLRLEATLSLPLCSHRRQILVKELYYHIAHTLTSWNFCHRWLNRTNPLTATDYFRRIFQRICHRLLLPQSPSWFKCCQSEYLLCCQTFYFSLFYTGPDTGLWFWGCIWGPPGGGGVECRSQTLIRTLVRGGG